MDFHAGEKLTARLEKGLQKKFERILSAIHVGKNYFLISGPLGYVLIIDCYEPAYFLVSEPLDFIIVLAS